MKLSDIQKLAKTIQLTEAELRKESHTELLQKLGMINDESSVDWNAY